VFDAGKSEQYIYLSNVIDAVGETLVLIFETAVDTRLEMFVFFPSFSGLQNSIIL